MIFNAQISIQNAGIRDAKEAREKADQISKDELDASLTKNRFLKAEEEVRVVSPEIPDNASESMTEFSMASGRSSSGSINNRNFSLSGLRGPAGEKIAKMPSPERMQKSRGINSDDAVSLTKPSGLPRGKIN